MSSISIETSIKYKLLSLILILMVFVVQKWHHILLVRLTKMVERVPVLVNTRLWMESIGMKSPGSVLLDTIHLNVKKFVLHTFPKVLFQPKHWAILAALQRQFIHGWVLSCSRRFLPTFWHLHFCNSTKRLFLIFPLLTV